MQRRQHRHGARGFLADWEREEECSCYSQDGKDDKWPSSCPALAVLTISAVFERPHCKSTMVVTTSLPPGYHPLMVVS